MDGDEERLRPDDERGHFEAAGISKMKVGVTGGYSRKTVVNTTCDEFGGERAAITGHANGGE